MRLISTHTILTSDIGVKGNLFGGRLLTWIDIAAFNYAVEEIRDNHLVTLKISECLFLQPIKVNNIIKVYGTIAELGRSSIEVAIEVKVLEVNSGKEDLVCTTSVTMVLVDECGKSKEIIVK